MINSFLNSGFKKESLILKFKLNPLNPSPVSLSFSCPSRLCCGSDASGKVCFGYSLWNGFPAHTGAHDPSALSQQQECHGEELKADVSCKSWFPQLWVFPECLFLFYKRTWRCVVTNLAVVYRVSRWLHNTLSLFVYLLSWYVELIQWNLDSINVVSADRPLWTGTVIKFLCIPPQVQSFALWKVSRYQFKAQCLNQTTSQTTNSCTGHITHNQLTEAAKTRTYPNWLFHAHTS